MTRPHIFAVNGSATFLDVVRDLFEDEGCTVTTTTVGPETLAQIARWLPRW